MERSPNSGVGRNPTFPTSEIGDVVGDWEGEEGGKLDDTGLRLTAGSREKRSNLVQLYFFIDERLKDKRTSVCNKMPVSPFFWGGILTLHFSANYNMDHIFM
jgi:hypothetical protein